MRGIEAQLHALQKGFSGLIPLNLLLPFDERELEVKVLLQEIVLLEMLLDFGKTATMLAYSLNAICQNFVIFIWACIWFMILLCM